MPFGIVCWWTRCRLASSATSVATWWFSSEGQLPTLTCALVSKFIRPCEWNMWSCRSPNQPRKLLVKRLVGLEGDWLLVSGCKDIVKVPKVTGCVAIRLVTADRCGQFATVTCVQRISSEHSCHLCCRGTAGLKATMRCTARTLPPPLAQFHLR